MNNYIITGGMGLIGFNLIRKIREKDENAKILVIDNLSKKIPVYLNKVYYEKRELADKIANKYNVKFIEYSLSNMNLTNDDYYLFQNDILEYFGENSIINTVFHLSAIPDPDEFYNVNKIFDVNFGGTNKLIKLLNYMMDSINVINFFFTSTSEVYGNQNKDITEITNLNINTKSKRVSYALSKLHSEFDVLHNLKNANRIFIGRIFNTYGYTPFADNRLIDNLLHANYTHRKEFPLFFGNSIRSFCYVDDLINEIFELIEYSNETYITKTIVNLGNPNESYSVKEAIEIFENVFGNKLRIVKYSNKVREGEPKIRKFKFDNFRQFSDYEPKYSFKDGLKEIKKMIENDKIF